MVRSGEERRQQALALAAAAAAGAAVLPLWRALAAAYGRHRDRKHRRFVLGSWRAREGGQPVRYLLAYLGLPWEDRFYDLGRAPEFGTQAWTGEAATPAERQQRSADKRRLPFKDRLSTYLLLNEARKGSSSGSSSSSSSSSSKSNGGGSGGGGVRKDGVVHGEAILRFLGRRHGMLGGSVQEAQAVEQLLAELQDFQAALTRLVYHPAFKTELDKFISQALPDRLKALEDWLLRMRVSGGGKACWAAGGAEPTIADFVLYDVVEQSRMLAGGILAAGGLKELQAFAYRFEALPNLPQYLASPAFQALPPYTRKAAFQPMPLPLP